MEYTFRHRSGITFGIVTRTRTRAPMPEWACPIKRAERAQQYGAALRDATARREAEEKILAEAAALLDAE